MELREQKKRIPCAGDRLRITNCASSNGSCWASGKNLGLRDGWSFFGDQRGDLISNNRTCQHSFFYYFTIPPWFGLCVLKGLFCGKMPLRFLFLSFSNTRTFGFGIFAQRCVLGVLKGVGRGAQVSILVFRCRLGIFLLLSGLSSYVLETQMLKLCRIIR